MFSLNRHKIGYVGNTDAQGVYFIVSTLGTEDLEVGAVGAECVVGEGAMEMLE